MSSAPSSPSSPSSSEPIAALLRAALGFPVDSPPVWVMRQAGRYLPEYNETKGDRDFFTVCRTPSLASTITLQPIQRYPLLSAAIIFSDILVVPQALGLECVMLEAKGPSFPDPLRAPGDLDLRRLNKAVDVKRELGYVFDAIRVTKRQLDARTPLFGFAGAPWTLMAYMIEGGGSRTFQHAKNWIFAHPDASHRLLSLITDTVVDFLVEQVHAGADILQVFDSWAGELSPHDFATFSLPYLDRIAREVKGELRAAGSVPPPMVVFAKGAGYALEQLCACGGYDVVGLDWTVDPRGAVAIAKGRVTLQGNLDPGVLYGGKEAITREVERMVRGFAGAKGRWIVNLGHGITPGVDPEDMGWFLHEVDRVGGEVYRELKEGKQET